MANQRVIEGIAKQLAANGLQKVNAEANPPLLVQFQAALSEQTQYNTLDTGMGYGPGWYRWGGGSSVTTVQNIPVGHLLVDIGDEANKRYIWRGTAEKTVSDKPEKNAKAIDKAITEMFKKFPPPPEKK